MEEEKIVNEQPENIPQKPTSHKKIIGLVLVTLIITAVMVIVFANISDFSKIWEHIVKMDTKYLWIAIACVVVYLATWPVSLMILTRKSENKPKKIDDFLIGGSEHFFNGITPFASGGQPIQVYLYHQNGMTAAQATGICLSNFIAFMIATNTYAIASLFFWGQFTATFTSATIWMVILGFFMNLFTLFFIILIASSSKVRNLFIKLFKALGKIKFLTKIIDKTLPKFEEYCNNFQLASKEIMSHKMDFFLAIIARGVSLLFYYCIPFFILKGLGVELTWVDAFFVLLASSFTITTMVWVPTPGGTGGIEFAFTYIFVTFFLTMENKDEIITASMIMWRFLTYYLLMFLSAIEYVIYEVIIKKRRKRKALEQAHD